jgi:hypothetical protein
LTNAVADRSKLPSDAASDAADARGLATPAATAEVVASQLLDAARGGKPAVAPSSSGSGHGSGSALEPGLVSSCAAIADIVVAGLEAYRARIAAGSGPAQGPFSSSSSSSERATPTERLAAAYEGLLRFLRARRATVKKYLMQWAAQRAAIGSALSIGNDSLVSNGSSFASTDLDAKSASSLLVQSHRVGSRGIWAAQDTAYSLSGSSQADIDALCLALDTAILKVCAITGRW